MTNRSTLPDHQNIDTPVDNPLYTSSVSPQTVKSESKPKDPKVKTLIILGSVLVVLLLLTLVASLIKSNQRKPIDYQPKINPTSIPTPSISDSQLPPKWAGHLDDLEKQVKTQIDFPPPQIDTDIGL